VKKDYWQVSDLTLLQVWNIKMPALIAEPHAVAWITLGVVGNKVRIYI